MGILFSSPSKKTNSKPPPFSFPGGPSRYIAAACTLLMILSTSRDFIPSDAPPRWLTTLQTATFWILWGGHCLIELPCFAYTRLYRQGGGTAFIGSREWWLWMGSVVVGGMGVFKHWDRLVAESEEAGEEGEEVKKRG